MALAWTTTELLVDIREQARIADDDPEASDTILLAEATRQLHKVFVPIVRKARAEYYQIWADQALVANTAYYTIPPRAAMASVRAVLIVDSGGRERELHPKPTQDRHVFTGRPGVPTHYAVMDDRLCLLPAPSSATLGTLRIVYEYRPSSLVAVASTGVLNTVASNVLTFTASSFTTATDQRLDCVKADPPFASCFLNALVTGTSGGGLVVTLTAADVIRTPALGDYLCHAGESPIPQIPAELHPWLAIATAASHLKNIDPLMSQSLREELKTGLKEASDILAPRQQGSQIKIRSKFSHLRRGAGTRRGTFDDFEP